MEEVKKIFVEHQIKSIADVDVIVWAGTMTGTSGPLAEDPDILEIASLDKSDRRELKRVETLLSKMIENAEGEFSLNSAEGEIYAREAFGKQCRRLVEGSIEPYDLCRCVFSVQSLFNSPGWLGYLPKLCEPIEPGTPAEAVSDLVTAAQAHLSAEESP